MTAKGISLLDKAGFIICEGFNTPLLAAGLLIFHLWQMTQKYLFYPNCIFFKYLMLLLFHAFSN